VLLKIRPKQGTKFYDLGSGTGKAVLAARLLHDFESCNGIEIINNLHEVAVKLKHKFEQGDELVQHTQFVKADNPVPQIHFECGDFLETDSWFDGDVVFINSTCFDEDLMESLSKKCESLKSNSYVITFTKPLDSKKFEILEKSRYAMSWGTATVYIHKRHVSKKDATASSSSSAVRECGGDEHNGGGLFFVRNVIIPSKHVLANDSDSDEESSIASDQDSESLYEDGRRG
jgi:hypothetical protein